MFPKNSRRPLTLDHKIRLKKNLAKAYKSAGISESESDRHAASTRRPHQQFKPKPENKIIRKRQEEEAERQKQREVNIIKHCLYIKETCI